MMKRKLAKVLTTLLCILVMLGMMMVSVKANEITPKEQVVMSEDETIYNTYQQYLAHYYLTYSTLDFYLEGDELPYHTYVNNADKDFKEMVMLWRAANMETSDLVEYTTKEVGFYQLIIFDILYQELSEDCILNNVSTAVNALQSSLLKDLAEVGENWALDTEITEKNAEQILKRIITICDDAKFLAEEVNVLKEGIEYTKTIEELINKLYMLIKLDECSGEVETILIDIYNNATDPLMKEACRQVAWVSTKVLTEEQIIKIFSGNVILQEASKIALDAIWEGLVDSNPLFDAIEIGQAVGKLFANILVSTDGITENWYSMEQVYKFEKVLKQQLLVYKDNYESNPTYNNAVVFNKAANMYLNTISVGMEYAINYVEKVKEKESIRFIYKNLPKKVDYNLLLKNLKMIKGNIDQTIEFINNETYNLYLEELEARNSVMVVWIKTPCEVTEEILDEQKEEIYEYIFRLTNQTTESDTTYDQDKLTYANYYHEKGTLDLAGRTLTVYGDFYLNGGTLNVNGGTLDVRGDMYVKGALSAANGNVNVGGTLVQSAGEIELNKGTLNVFGDYYMAIPEKNSTGEIEWDRCSSKLLMNYAEDKVTVYGDFYMNTRSGSSCEFKAGLLAVAGNFAQKYMDSSYRFQASDAHVVMLNGTEPQYVMLEDDGGGFATIKIENDKGIIVKGYFAADSLTSSKEKVIIESEGMELQSLTVDVSLVVIKGDVNKGVDTLKLVGNELQIEGNLIQTKGIIDISKGALKVSGDYYMAIPEKNSAGEIEWNRCSSKLLMNYAEDKVTVYGDFYMNTRSGSSCEFKAGLLAVAGNFTQKYMDSSYRFQASDAHKVLLFGKKQQNVTLEYHSSKFNILQINKDISEYTFNPDPCWVILEEVQEIPEDCKLRYLVTYDANGGDGAPSGQIKDHGEELILSETIPYRKGYTFLGWSMDAASTEAEYLPGDQFTLNKKLNLYAVWEAVTYVINYDANGGSDAPDRQNATYEQVIMLSTKKPFPMNSYIVSFNNNDGSGIVNDVVIEDEFVSWNTQKDGSGNSYYPGQNYTVYENQILYAQWNDAVLNNINNVERTGYYFMGWYDSTEVDRNGYPIGVKYIAPIEIKDNINLYAMWLPIEMLVYGDVSGDGKVSVSDLAVVSRYVSGETDLSYSVSEFLLRADLDRDGDVDAEDLDILSSLVNGSIMQEELEQAYLGSEANMLRKENYAYGENAESSDFSLIVSFDGTASYTITEGLSVIGYDPYQPGKQTVRIAFYQFSAECDVIVKEKNASCTITLDTQNGTLPSGVNNLIRVDYGVALGNLPMCEREGYIFKGWYTSLENGELVTNENICYGDLILYALWEKDTISPHEHVYTVLEVIEATCTELGEVTYICTLCSDKYAEEIPMKDHVMKDTPDNRVEASCTEEGYSGDFCCLGCGVVMQGGEILPADHQWHVDSVNSAVDCGEKGKTIYKCSNCDELKEEVSIHHHNTFLKNQYGATCVKPGYSGDVFCNDCETVISRGQIIEPFGHEWEMCAVIYKNSQVGLYMDVFRCRICDVEKSEVRK